MKFVKLVKWRLGQLGDPATQREMSKVARVVIAGNSVCHEARDREHATRAKYLTKKGCVETKVSSIAWFLLSVPMICC